MPDQTTNVCPRCQVAYKPPLVPLVVRYGSPLWLCHKCADQEIETWKLGLFTVYAHHDNRPPTRMRTYELAEALRIARDEMKNHGATFAVVGKD